MYHIPRERSFNIFGSLPQNRPCFKIPYQKDHGLKYLIKRYTLHFPASVTEQALSLLPSGSQFEPDVDRFN